MGLLITIFISCFLLIIINYFTIKTMSAVRSYISGESLYSKGDKDASRNLIVFLHTGDITSWQAFRENLEIPLSDSRARVMMSEDGNEDSIRQELLAGKNHADDLDNMIWLFKNFQHMFIMEEPIKIWRDADGLIYEKLQLGDTIRSMMLSGRLAEDDKLGWLDKINRNTDLQTRAGYAFSKSLGDAARSISNYLFFANVVITLLILGSFTAYMIIAISQFEEKHEDLVRVNQELDRFVYSVSHDLKAPIASLNGLVDIARMDTDPRNRDEYLAKMQLTLNKQDSFIKEIVNFSRNKWSLVRCEEISLSTLVDHVITIHRYMPEARDIQFEKNIIEGKFFCDAIRLEIVVNNLVSNAIKHHAPEKTHKRVTISASVINHHVIIEVADNGLGIDKEDLSKIFNMFYGSTGKGSGLGLYIVHETIKKMNGTIRVNSLKGEGSTFTITLPDQHYVKKLSGLAPPGKMSRHSIV